MQSVQAALEYLFDQSASIQLAVFAVHGLLVFGLSMAFILLFNRREDVGRWTPVGPYFASISIVFALFLAFQAPTSGPTSRGPNAPSSTPAPPSSGSTT
jgi:hypothetical protein